MLRYGSYLYHQKASIRADAQNELLLDPLFQSTVCNEMSTLKPQTKRGGMCVCVCIHIYNTHTHTHTHIHTYIHARKTTLTYTQKLHTYIHTHI